MYEGLLIDIDYLLNVVKELKINFDKKIKTLNLLIERNIPIVLYTENNKEYVDTIMKYLKIKEPAIIVEGAQIYSPFDLSYEAVFPLSINTVCKLGNWAMDRKMDMSISTDKKVIDYSEWLKELRQVNYKNAGDKLPSAVKVDICMKNDDKRIELLNFIGKNNLECYAHMYLNHVACINSIVDKGNTLKYLANKKKWDIKKFAMIGDYSKDTSIFDEVGFLMSISDFTKDFEKNFDKTLKSDMMSIV
ncbi:hydroxymethylpyrimidine pyrophosphatase-like HAD family hydrolase [Clostridium acetobutylicum]|uniref:Uncharacterized protein n=1 Tax=Clostridium acetobutylicum (strain ATCC 824 / DSM 792 / JCM 1419 / IAM 19013 / LMG 5710 / NBRC 13948 / NRRL B-527 / VKM B-1787 / 2291 / W) TaxID=272562 RepID=Q97J53_CLOAB|nr:MULTISPECIES: HAD hydrolase family protein [Clostridium]AAK79401.1 Hypothetical protein CA_C1433 [Clostridium acetobutylicum ATCC 824]ADZ20486.1 Conserved hypothetical protein [Clostridium acetobutylicum EA 2018]AEI31801.1 hypothetical protein SMB_G1458 [Clostridium acetobutylicum DSM 1731]AWV81350.1 hypothetical protein DK921_14870 [Clostridium acetobutylicum]MBC2392984.1 HAD hydrolase family protein [Clostridium acetobutylicum]